MKRAIIVSPVPAPEALAELKQWLGLSGPREDAALTRLIGAALDMCEGFTGQLPLAATAEEVLTADGAWQQVASRPVHALLAVEAVAPNGTRTPLAAEAYALELDANGGARVRVVNPALSSLGSPGRIAVRFVAGLAPTWSALPESLRHGIIRFAAHQHRSRENSVTEMAPPSAVTALWRPWRAMRLA